MWLYRVGNKDHYRWVTKWEWNTYWQVSNQNEGSNQIITTAVYKYMWRYRIFKSVINKNN